MNNGISSYLTNNVAAKFMLRTSQRHFLTMNYPELKTLYDEHYQSLWCFINSDEQAVMSNKLLQRIRLLQDKIAELHLQKPQYAPRYIVWASAHGRNFSLGLDLNYIISLVEQKNAKLLQTYLMAYFDAWYLNLINFELPIISIALLHGKAYGSGFEMGLASNFIIASHDARCGFPEIKYNLMPNISAMNILTHNVHHSEIDALVLAGKVYSASYLHQLGLIDLVTERDKLYQEAVNFIAKSHKKHATYHTMYKLTTRKNLVTYDELNEFCELWMQSMLNLSHSEICQLKRVLNFINISHG